MTVISAATIRSITLESPVMLLEASLTLLEDLFMHLESSFTTIIVYATVAVIVNYDRNIFIVQTPGSRRIPLSKEIKNSISCGLYYKTLQNVQIS